VRSYRSKIYTKSGKAQKDTIDILYIDKRVNEIEMDMETEKGKQKL